MKRMTDDQVQVCINALYTANEKYRECKKEILASDLPEENKKRLADQFEKQVQDCSSLIDWLEM